MGTINDSTSLQRIAQPIAAVEVDGLRKHYGAVDRGRRRDVRRRAGRDLRVPRAQRRRQVHDDQDAVHPGRSRRPARRASPARRRERRDDVRRNIGLVFQDPTLDTYLTAEQNLRFHAELYGMPRAGVAGRDAAGARDGRPVGAPRRPGADVLRRHAAPARDRPRPAALAAGAVPRRADGRARPADPGDRSGATSTSCASGRRSRSSSRPTTWTRPSTATGSRSSTPAGSSCSTRPSGSRRASAPTGCRSRTADDEAAIAALRERFGIDGRRARRARSRSASRDGEEFVPRLFAELGVPITRCRSPGRRSTTCSCPTPAATIRDAEATAADRIRAFVMAAMTDGER